MTEESPGLLYCSSKFTLSLCTIAEMVQRLSRIINLGRQAVVQLACCTHPSTCIYSDLKGLVVLVFALQSLAQQQESKVCKLHRTLSAVQKQYAGVWPLCSSYHAAHMVHF